MKDLIKEARKILTHNGVFHADEILAIVLILIFVFKVKVKDIKVTRTRNESLIKTAKNEGSFVIDVGGEYNEKNLFDHHQEKMDFSSAGLIWKHIKKTLSLSYPQIDRLVKMVDDTDLGRKTHGEFSFPSLISKFNNSDIYGKDQETSFNKALDFAYDMIKAMKEEQEELNEAKEISSKIEKIRGLNGAYILPVFTRHWSKFINGETRKEVKVIIWFDKNQNKWLMQSSPIKINSFDLYGPFFKEVKTKMNFVHKSGFFAVSDTEDFNEVISFLKENGL